MASEKRGGALSQFLGRQQPPAPRPAAKGAAKAAKAPGKRAAKAAAAPASDGGRAPAAKRRLADGREQLLVYLQPEGIRELKVAAAYGEGESVSAIVAEAVNAWLQQHGRQPLA